MGKGIPEIDDALKRGSNDALAALDADRARAGDFAGLFYARLMQARLRLGVAPTPTRPTAELPADRHGEYETAIRESALSVGAACLERGEVVAAWSFFRLVGEVEPLRRALETYSPADEDQLTAVIDIALQQGVHPRRGFDWLLERRGICSAISALSAFESMPVDDKRYCVGELVRALYDQLVQAVRATIAEREGAAPDGSLRDLLVGRDWLFSDECYFVDLSHLSATAQMSLDLQRGEALGLARQLCDFGARLPERFRTSGGVPPFADGYADYGRFLAVIAGDDVEANLESFRRAARDARGTTFPAEVLVNLLLRADRDDEAFAVAREFLTQVDEGQLLCPGPLELAYRRRDFAAMADIAADRGDTVHYLAARLEERGGA